MGQSVVLDTDLVLVFLCQERCLRLRIKINQAMSVSAIKPTLL